jgi:SnoaL-like domain
MAITPAQWLAAYRQAWIDRNADAAAALFTENATYAEAPYQDAFVGRQGIRDYWARVTATQSGVDVKYGNALTVGDQTVVEWWATLSNGDVPITLAGCFLLRFNADGLCHTLREYWAFSEGTLQPRPGWGK